MLQCGEFGKKEITEFSEQRREAGNMFFNMDMVSTTNESQRIRLEDGQEDWIAAMDLWLFIHFRLTHI